MSLKDRISSPLEAGTSILDAHHLPPHILPALEWTSSRLARKSLHLTLVVARRDYHVPIALPPKGSPGLSTPTTPASATHSPSLRLQLSSGPVSALKQLVRSGSYSGPTPKKSMQFSRAGMASPTFSTQTVEVPMASRGWPMSPTTPLSPPPMTPCTASTTTTDTMSSIMSSGTFGMRLIHASGLPAKAERALRSTLEKADKRFHLGPEWLSPAVSPSASGLTNQLIHWSILQNEVLFSSEGLTLVSLDRIYSLKSALSSYSKTKSHLRLEDAVDELRRYILANNGAKVSKSDILRSYDWLSVSNSALTDLDRMYRRAYGGPEQLGAISGMTGFLEPGFLEPAIKPCSGFEDGADSDSEDEIEIVDEKMEMGVIGIALTTVETPSPKPLLKLQTSFGSKPQKPEIRLPKQEDGDDDEDDDRTARPTDRLVFTMHPWHTGNGGTIDQVLSAPLLSPGIMSPDLLSPRQSHVGPMTPNGYEDISPTTRGEWGFLMVDDAFRGAKTAAVETC